APGAITVRPLPLIVPPAQFISLMTVSTPFPASVPPSQSHESSILRLPRPHRAGAPPGPPTVRFRHTTSLLLVIWPVTVTKTLSFEAGTILGFQFARVCQSPFTPDRH